MTIAACYLSAEGIVLGADSTTTMFVAAPGPHSGGREHHYNFAQKIFQIGSDGTLAIAMWGLGSLPNGPSYRTMIAEFSDSLTAKAPCSMRDVADRWNLFFWTKYESALGPLLERARALSTQLVRSPAEEEEFTYLVQNLSGGFCLGGCCLPDRTPNAFEIVYSPELLSPPAPKPQQIGTTLFWGCPNLINRLLFGVDFNLISSILASGKWTGTDQELFDLVQPHVLGQPLQLPIREAIDWVHASIYATIKTMKFSHMAPVCGGPIEVAAITTDRPFRWVRHKSLDAAMSHDGFTYV